MFRNVRIRCNSVIQCEMAREIRTTGYIFFRVEGVRTMVYDKIFNNGFFIEDNGMSNSPSFFIIWLSYFRQKTMGSASLWEIE